MALKRDNIQKGAKAIFSNQYKKEVVEQTPKISLSPKTGDSRKLGIMCLILVGAFGMLAFGMKMRQKNSKK